jgi:hypothetical protein
VTSMLHTKLAQSDDSDKNDGGGGGRNKTNIFATATGGSW